MLGDWKIPPYYQCTQIRVEVIILCPPSRLTKQLSLHKLHQNLFFFSFGVLHLMLPEAPQPYGLLYYPPYWTSNFLHQFRAATHAEQKKLEL
jgi:hypothetical protein